MGEAATRFHVLGPLRVHDGSRQVTPSGRLQRTLLSLLLVHANEAVSAGTLAGALWDGAPADRSAARLQLLVHRLRRLLDHPDRLSYGPLGYSLRIDPGELDAQRFDALVDEAVADGLDAATTAARARAALALWQGPPFQDVDAVALEPHRRRWDERRRLALERYFEAELALGRHGAVLVELDQAARDEPLDEQLQALLMTALYRAGRQGEALEVYRRTRQVLVDELGIDPGPALRALHEQVLAGELLEPGARVPVPAQLPPDPPHLTGRNRDLARMDAAFEGSPSDASRLLVVTGTAGVGKTALAVHWAHRHRAEFPDGQLFVDLRGFSTDEPAAPAEVLAAFIRAVGGDANALAPGLEERVGLFRSLADGRRLLIVLDNARSAEQVRDLVPGTSGCVVLVTSRETLAGLAVRDGAESVDLDRLDPADSLQLLAELAGDRVRDDVEGSAQLVAHCAQLPLALRITAEHVRARPARPVAALVAEIADERERLDLLDAGDGPATDVRAVFSWSYESLPADAARVFRLLGLLPGRDADAETVAALCDLELREARRQLRILVRAHLVEERPGARYGQHDLLRAYAAELAATQETEAVRSSVRSRLLGYYSRMSSVAMQMVQPSDTYDRPDVAPVGAAEPVFVDLAAAVRWLNIERAAIIASTRAVGRDDGHRVIELSQTLRAFLGIQGHIPDALELHGTAVVVAQHLGDVEAEARAELAVGGVSSRLGDLEGAKTHLTRSLALSRSVGSRTGEAAALNNIALVASMRGEYLECIRLLREALELLRAEGDQGRTAVALSNIGENLRELGRYDEAVDHLQEAIELARTHGFHKTLGFSLCCLTELYESIDEFGTALTCGLEAAEVARSSGNRVTEGEAYEAVGTIHRRRGEVGQALSHYEAALSIGRSTGECQLTAAALEGLARTHAPDDPQAALDYFDEAVEVATRHELRTREARVRLGLADVHERLGDPAAAQPHLERTAQLFDDLADPRADEVRARISRPG